MKMPRFFIVLGACALLAISTYNLSWSQSLPIQRADPWAGDPDEPGFTKSIPFNDGEDYVRTTTPYELSADTARSPKSLWTRFGGRTLLFMLLSGRR